MADRLTRLFFNLPALLGVALVANLALIASARFGVGFPMGDLSLAYQPWAEQMLAGQGLLGINTAWVYPWPASIPMVLSQLIAPGNLETAWLVARVAVMLVALTIFVRFRPSDDQAPRYLAAYTWVLFTFALGPVSISRIDSVSVVLAVLGVLAVIAGSRTSGSAWFTVAAWIKIWPIAMFTPLMFARKVWWRILASGFSVTALAVLTPIALGGNLKSVFSFAAGQSSRGLQIESPFAMPWLWTSATGDRSSGISYNQALLTFEVFGPGTRFVADWLTLVQIGAVLITVTLCFFANRAIGFNPKAPEANDILVWSSFTFVLDLIVFNKVGSPQFISWIAVPLVLAVGLGVRRIGVAYWLSLATTLVTWLVYPWIYDAILADQLPAILVLTLRNAMEIALLVYGNYRLTNLAMSGFKKLAK